MFQFWDQAFGASESLGSAGAFVSPGLVDEATIRASHVNANLVVILALQVPIFIGQGCHGHVGL